MGIETAIAGIGAAGSILGGRSQAKAASSAADRSADIQLEMYDRTEERLKPWVTAGGDGLDAYMRELGFTESGYNATELPDLSYDNIADGFQESPGYQYALEQGQQAIQNSASARGNLHSGNTQLELLRHAMGIADQGFGQYYDRNRSGIIDNHNLREQRMTRLENLSGTGLQAAGQTGQFGASAAQNAGNTLFQGATAAAGANAGGIAGAVNNINGGLAAAGQTAQNNALFRAAYPSYAPPSSNISSIFSGI